MINMKQKIFEKQLLQWHNYNKRDFEWRKTDDPYKILISEILLHKTDSKKVEEIYQDVICKYPTIHHVFDTEIEHLEKGFKEIGLFYRAKRLKKNAEIIISRYNNKIPDEKERLMQLNGIGNYISNAILCFAYKKGVPIVDTNVIRIYSRIFNIKSQKSRPQNDKDIWNYAKYLLPDKNYKSYNYAILDFGSKICKARKPLCTVCIFRNDCYYYKKVKENESKIDQIYA